MFVLSLKNYIVLLTGAALPSVAKVILIMATKSIYIFTVKTCSCTL